MREIKFRAWHKDYGMIYDNQNKVVKPLRLRGYADKHFSKPRVYHDTIQVWFFETSLAHATDDFFDHPTHINGAEIMQYTGLKDKNGVEIYENDLIAFSVCKGSGEMHGEPHAKHQGYMTQEGFIGTVIFEDCEYKVSNVKFKKAFEDTAFVERMSRSNYNKIELDFYCAINKEKLKFCIDMVVIGNIHQNPELLKP